MKFFLCSSSLHEWKIRSCHTTWQSLHTYPPPPIISRIFTFSQMKRTSRLLLGLEALPALLPLHFGAIFTVSKGFLNKNTTIARQLIQTARTLEAEWCQVCVEMGVWGQREMSQVLGAFGLLDFTMLGPVLTWRAFWNLWTIYFFNFPIFFRSAVNRRYGGPPVLWKVQHPCIHGVEDLILLRCYVMLTGWHIVTSLKFVTFILTYFRILCNNSSL